MHRFDIFFLFVLRVNKNIIQIHNDKVIKLFHKNLIDIALDYCQSIGQSKKHYLILKIVVSGPESSFPLISFANSYPVINTGEVELSKLPSLPQSI